MLKITNRRALFTCIEVSTSNSPLGGTPAPFSVGYQVFHTLPTPVHLNRSFQASCSCTCANLCDTRSTATCILSFRREARNNKGRNEVTQGTSFTVVLRALMIWYVCQFVCTVVVRVYLCQRKTVLGKIELRYPKSQGISLLSTLL